MIIYAYATRSVETEPKLKPLLKQKEAIMTKMKSLKHSAAAAREKGGRGGEAALVKLPIRPLKSK